MKGAETALKGKTDFTKPTLCGCNNNTTHDTTKKTGYNAIAGSNTEPKNKATHGDSAPAHCKYRDLALGKTTKEEASEDE